MPYESAGRDEFSGRKYADTSIFLPQMKAQEIGVLAGSNGVAGWSNNSEIITPMMPHTTETVRAPVGDYHHGRAGEPRVVSPIMVHQTSMALNAPTDPDDAGWPNRIDDISPSMINHTPATVGAQLENAGAVWQSNTDINSSVRHDAPMATGAPSSSDGWPQVGNTSRTPQPPSANAWREYERAAWTNLGGSSSFRSLAPAAMIGSEGTISPAPSESVYQIGHEVKIDSAKWTYPSGSISHATRKMRKVFGVDGTSRPGHSSPASQPSNHVFGIVRRERTEWHIHSAATSHTAMQISGASESQVHNDQAGWPHFFDAEAGQWYPFGGGHHPQSR